MLMLKNLKLRWSWS